MKSLFMALQSKEGHICLIGMVVGIVVACVGGYLLQSHSLASDIAVLAGSIFSMVGAERFCRLIIEFRNETGEE